MKKYLIILSVLILLLVSCQQRSEINISLSIDPPSPTADSTATVRLLSSFDVGITLASISIDGKTVKSGDTLPLEYLWRPSEAKDYIVEGYVENIFGQRKTSQTILTVVDKTAPVIDQIRIIPTFPESDSPIYLSIDAHDSESRVLKAVAKIGSESKQVQTTDNPIIMELPPQNQPGQYPLSIVVSTSDFAKSATSTVLNVYPPDLSAPTVDVSLLKSSFSKEEDVVLNITVEDDTELSSVSVECNSSVIYTKDFSKTNSASFSVKLGKFDPGFHSVVVTAKDVRGKSTVSGAVFAVGLGPVDVSLWISNSSPSPADLITLSAETKETLVKQITFYVDDRIISQGTSFSCYWKAVSGRHVLSVVVETTDGRVGTDFIQIDVQDEKPPKIDSFKIGSTELKTDSYTTITAGYYGVRMNISDDTALKQGGTITVIISSKPFPEIKPVGTMILIQESISDDLKQASYVGATSFAQGTYYLMPTGIKDIYENQTGNLYFPIEVK